MALAAVRGDKTLAELSQQHDVHPNQITDWKNQLLAKAADVFGGEPRADEPTVDLKVLHAKIGQLALENERVTRFTMLLHLPLLAGHMPGAHTKNGPAMIGHGAEAVRNAIAAKIATQNNWAGR